MAVGQLLRLDVNSVGAGANYAQLLSVSVEVPAPTAYGQLLRVDVNTIALGGSSGQLSRVEVTTPTLSRTAADLANVEPWTTVTLTGIDQEWSGANRLWVQTVGPALNVTQLGKTATFRAPGSMVGVALSFEYRVAANLPATQSVDVQRATQFKVVGGALVPCWMGRAVA